jgi:hypothetical protein
MSLTRIYVLLHSALALEESVRIRYGIKNKVIICEMHDVHNILHTNKIQDVKRIQQEYSRHNL